MNFWDFLIFFIKNEFLLFKIDFISAQLTWHNLERPIARLIVTVDRPLRQGV